MIRSHQGITALLGAIVLGIILGGCANTPGPNSFTPGEAMTVGQVASATVVSVRQVLIRPNAQTGSAGSLVGAVVGGVAGSSAGKGRGQTLMSLGGAILGSILGRNAENVSSTQKALQVILTTEDGRTISIVQPAGIGLQPGEKVWLIRYRTEYGDRYRVEPKTGAAGDSGHE